MLDGDSPIDAIVARAVDRGERSAGTTATLANEVGPTVVMQRLVFRGEPLDEALTVHLVDEIDLPLLRYRQLATMQEPITRHRPPT